MKRTLERMARRFLPLIVAANITPAISYGQECGESFETENMNGVKTEYTLQCNFNGKDRVWTYVDKKGDVRESDKQIWPQGQYNQEVGGRDGKSEDAVPPIPPKPQVVPLPTAPAAPSSEVTETERLKAAAKAQEERDEQNKMLDLADQKFKAEEKARREKADEENKAALAKKEEKAKTEKAAADKSAADNKAKADKLAAEKKAAGAGSSQSQDKEDGRSIYDFAVGVSSSRSSYSERGRLKVGADYLSGKDRSVVQLGVGYGGFGLSLRAGSIEDKEVTKLKISAGSLTYNASDTLQDANSTGIGVSYDAETKRFTFHVAAAYDSWRWNRSVKENLSNSSRQTLTSKDSSKSYEKSSSSVQIGFGFKPTENLELRVLAEQGNFNFDGQLERKGYKSPTLFGAGVHWSF